MSALSPSTSPPPSSSSPSSCTCRSLRSCGPLTRRAWDRITSSTYGVKFCSILIMLECAYIALTGRGVISILHAIIGVIFAVEGFWGAVRFDRPSIKRFLIFLCFDFIAGVAIGILDLETVGEYCQTADDGDNCHQTYTSYAYVLIAVSAVTIPIFFIVSTLFYLKLITVHQAQRERTGMGRKGGGGEEWDKVNYYPGELMVEDEDDEEEGYPGTMIQGDVDEDKQRQVRTELAILRGDSEELQQLEEEGSVVIRESDQEDEKG